MDIINRCYTHAVTHKHINTYIHTLHTYILTHILILTYITVTFSHS